MQVINMKKLILLAAAFAAFQANCQEKPQELNCYNKWALKFEDRGADEVADGLYDDVIITNRQGAKATCHNGRAEVRKGLVVHCYMLLSDGTYDEVRRSWKNNTDENVTITNGISKPMLSIQGELINVLWPNKIRPKKAKPIAAADPTDD
jgi:hypothetical protein